LFPFCSATLPLHSIHLPPSFTAHTHFFSPKKKHTKKLLLMPPPTSFLCCRVGCLLLCSTHTPHTPHSHHDCILQPATALPFSVHAVHRKPCTLPSHLPPHALLGHHRAMAGLTTCPACTASTPTLWAILTPSHHTTHALHPTHTLHTHCHTPSLPTHTTLHCAHTWDCLPLGDPIRRPTTHHFPRPRRAALPPWQNMPHYRSGICFLANQLYSFITATSMPSLPHPHEQLTNRCLTHTAPAGSRGRVYSRRATSPCCIQHRSQATSLAHSWASIKGWWDSGHLPALFFSTGGTFISSFFVLCTPCPSS